MLKYLFGIIVVSSLISCEDPELNELMDDYCDCINTSKYDQSNNFECIELMDSIQKKYENQPRKLNKVLEKTNECY
tara:strand:+ start:275 stop:502 length:228 start_codon:yes stop_codon:yes gene_type:complete